ncbi:F-box/FBD/LRR-repeat protein [Morus notabilis]|uniref:F-box/FBD/LRR-repeat protein n=1 Tax=Morus notabilis TaxID=981085 RepID=W9RD91_9ROSA|nr:F-box/FBD/LRR-repeat protein [Morus notabilis]
MAKRRKIEETKEDDNNHIHHQDQQNNIVSDRLSGLPDNLIRHILSLLPIGDAFRTRRLCKAWFLAWASDPVLDVNNQENFVDFVDKTLLQFKDNILIQKFKLYKLIYGEDIDRVENLLSFVAERNVRELDIDTKTNQIPCTLSQSVLHANSLTVLKLVNLTLKVNNNVDFVTLKSLKILSLKYVNLDDESARKIISSSSSLEQFDLLFCIGLKRLTISNSKLKNSKLKALKIAHCKCSRIEFDWPQTSRLFLIRGIGLATLED